MHVELVELELIRSIGAVIRGESREPFAEIGEVEPGAFLGDEAPQRIDRLAAGEHVLDLLDGDDAGVMPAPDDLGELGNDGKVALDRADDASSLHIGHANVDRRRHSGELSTAKLWGEVPARRTR
jgi:hypothetical protein